MFSYKSKQQDVKLGSVPIRTRAKKGITAFLIIVASMNLSPTSCRAFDLTSVVTSSTSTGDIVSSVTSGLDLNGIIDQLLSSLGDFDGGISDIFNEFNIESIIETLDASDQVLGCLASDRSYYSSTFGGICSIATIGNLGGRSPQLGGFLDCIEGTNAGSLGTNPLNNIYNLVGKISGMCRSSRSSSTGSTDVSIDTDSDSTITASVSSVDYDPNMASIVSSIEMSGIGAGSATNNIGNIPSPSGDTLKKIDGDDGGIIIRQLKANPNSSTAKAYRDMDKYTLLLQRLVAFNVSSSDLSKKLDISMFSLPETPLDVKQKEADLVNLMAGHDVNLFNLQNKIVIKVRPLYTEIVADTLNDYYIKEREKFQEFISGDFARDLEGVRKGAYKTIEARYALKLFNMVLDKDYMFDVSNQALSRISPELKSKLIVKAIVQMNKEVEIKAQMAFEKNIIEEAISRTVERAYTASSIFRGDIAKKEIDELLKAVDNAIQ